MRISDWSSDVCSSDLAGRCANAGATSQPGRAASRLPFDGTEAVSGLAYEHHFWRRKQGGQPRAGLGAELDRQDVASQRLYAETRSWRCPNATQIGRAHV